MDLEWNPVERDFPSRRAADIFYLAHAKQQRNAMEMVTTVRLLGGIDRIYVYSARKAIVLEGSPDQIALAEWLVPHLDQNVMGTSLGEKIPGRAVARFAPTGSKDEVTVFYFATMPKESEPQKLINDIRGTAHVALVYACYTIGAIAVRGTAEEIEAVDKLVGEQHEVEIAGLTPAGGVGAK